MQLNLRFSAFDTHAVFQTVFGVKPCRLIITKFKGTNLVSHNTKHNLHLHVIDNAICRLRKFYLKITYVLLDFYNVINLLGLTPITGWKTREYHMQKNVNLAALIETC
jgi:hypothetical protein